MESLDLQEALAVARQAVADAMVDALVMPSQVEAKGDATDVVTERDRSIERAIRQRISQHFPTHRVVGEEYGETAQVAQTAQTAQTAQASRVAECSWFIDPIDGTTNYAAGLPWYAISVALMQAQTPVVGVVGMPAVGVIASAARGAGVEIAGNGPLAERMRAMAGQAASLTGGVALMEWDVAQPWEGMDHAIGALRAGSVTTRIMGSGTLAIAQVALGAAAAAFIGGYDPIDHGAAACLALESGCGLWKLGTHEAFDPSTPTPEPFYVAHASQQGRIRELLHAQ